MTPEIPADAKPTLKHNVPIITFLARTWMLLIFVLASNWLALWKHEFFVRQLPDGTMQGFTLAEMWGAPIYFPAIISTVFFLYLLMLHLFFRDTLDKDAHDGTYIADWRALSSYERIQMSTWLRIGFIIAFCILCASMARG
jgi:fatty acid desaturase